MRLQSILTGVIALIVISMACIGAAPTATLIPLPSPSPTTPPTPILPPLDPDPAVALEAQIHRQAADELKDQGQFEEAIREYDKSILLNPEHPDSYNGRGVAYVLLGQFERGVQEFDAAIDRDQRFAEAYNNRGLAYSRLGQIDLAIED